jgi:hypothetical protein
MSEKREGESDRWLSVWETESIGEWENGEEKEGSVEREREQQTGQEMWVAFQNAASNIASLYKGKSFFFHLMF